MTPFEEKLEVSFRDMDEARAEKDEARQQLEEARDEYLSALVQLEGATRRLEEAGEEPEWDRDWVNEQLDFYSAKYGKRIGGK